MFESASAHPHDDMANVGSFCRALEPADEVVVFQNGNGTKPAERDVGLATNEKRRIAIVDGKPASAKIVCPAEESSRRCRRFVAHPEIPARDRRCAQRLLNCPAG